MFEEDDSVDKGTNIQLFHDFFLAVFDVLYDGPIQLDPYLLAYLVYVKLNECDEVHS